MCRICLSRFVFSRPPALRNCLGQARLFFATGAPSYSCSGCGCPLIARCVGAVVGGPRWPDEVNAGGWAQWLTLPTTALDLLPQQCVCPPRLGKVMGLSRSSCRTITLHERVVYSLVILVLDFSSTGVQDLLVQVCFFPPTRPEELFGPGSSLLRDRCAVIFLQRMRLPINRPMCGRSRWRPQVAG